MGLLSSLSSLPLISLLSSMLQSMSLFCLFNFDVRFTGFLIQIVLFKQEMHAELSDELNLIQILIKFSEILIYPDYLLHILSLFVDFSFVHVVV